MKFVLFVYFVDQFLPDKKAIHELHEIARKALRH